MNVDGRGDGRGDATDFDAARALFVEGLAHLQAGLFADAQRALEASLARMPGRPSTLVNLGIARARLGRPAAAIEAFDAALAAAPDDLDAWCHRGSACAALGRDAGALESFERALAIDPRHAGARYHHAVALHKLGRIGAAREAVESLLRDDPALAEAWSLLGQVERDAGHGDAAIAAFQRAIREGADADVHRYFIAGLRGGADAPAATPPAYVRGLFDDYSAGFEAHLLHTLRYRAHDAVAAAARRAAAGHRWRSVLDLGCGTGLVGHALRSQADRIEGVDLAPAMVERSRESGAYDALACADLLTHLCAEPDAAHDLVVAADVFIYVGDLDPVFAQVKRVLAPGGTFVFSVESTDGAAPALHAQLRYAHGEGYLRALAARHGLAVESIEPAVLREEQRRPVDGRIAVLRG